MFKAFANKPHISLVLCFHQFVGLPACLPACLSVRLSEYRYIYIICFASFFVSRCAPVFAFTMWTIWGWPQFEFLSVCLLYVCICVCQSVCLYLSAYLYACLHNTLFNSITSVVTLSIFWWHRSRRRTEACSERWLHWIQMHSYRWEARVAWSCSGLSFTCLIVCLLA